MSRQSFNIQAEAGGHQAFIRGKSLIGKSYSGAASGLGVIIVDHRLNGIRKAGRILVLEKRAIVEQGNHDELMSADGIYAGLYRGFFSNPASS